MPAYSGKAQPYLDAIAESVFTSQDVRNWLITGTPVEPDYLGSSVLMEEQRALRWRIKPTKRKRRLLPIDLRASDHFNHVSFFG